MKVCLFLIGLFSFLSSYGQTDLKKIMVNKNDSLLIEYNYLMKDSCICSSIIDNIQKREIFINVNEYPTFGKCNTNSESMTNVRNYIRRNISFINEQHATGRVFVKFIVETNGEISNIQVLKSLEKEIDEEIIKTIKKMPKWKSGKCNGKEVPMYILFPVTISLDY